MNRRLAIAVEWAMVRSIVVLAAALGVLFTAALAEASDLRRGSIIPRVGPIIPHGRNIVPNPPPERFPHHDRKRDHHDKGKHHHRHHHRHGGVVVVSPPVFYAAPRQCVSEGYWAYQWIPTSYAQTAWVPGGLAPDGTWIEGRWEQRAYASGYYQPYWVPGQTYSC